MDVNFEIISWCSANSPVLNLWPAPYRACMAVGGKNFGLFVVHALATVSKVAAFDLIVSAIATCSPARFIFCSSLLNVYTFHTLLIRTSSAGRCRGFTKSFPSLMVSSYSSYSIPFSSPSLQNHLYPFLPKSLGVRSCVLACQAVWRVFLIPYSYRVPKPYQLC